MNSITNTLTGKRRGLIPSRRVFYRFDEKGKPHKCVYSPSLPCLLNMWGVRQTRLYKHSGARSDRVKLIRDCELHDLVDLHTRAKAIYRSRLSAAHPDKGGDPELAVALNCAWDNTERLFRKRGLEV